MITTYDEAREFLGEVFCGYHHIPSEIKQWGEGWYIWTKRNLATFDSDLLTRLVVIGHDEMFRVEIESHGFHGVKIIVHKREARTGQIFKRHPTIESHISAIRGRTKVKDFIVKNQTC